MGEKSMKVEEIETSRIIPYANNPRQNDQAVSAVAASIKEFGFRQPIVTDEELVVLVGHTRLKAAQSIGLSVVPVHIAEGLTEAQKKAYRIADNRLNELAEWDNELLSLELEALTEADFDIGLLGFSDEELDELLAGSTGTEGNTDPDDVPEVPENPVTKLGDIWLLGEHRAMCGDSTSIEQAEELMRGETADMVFTDPPYNVAYSGRGKDNKLGTILNDDMPCADFEQFCRDVFATYFAVMRPLACIYVCHTDSQTGPKLAFEQTFGALFKKSSTIIWVKQAAGMGWQDYRSQHEPILYGWKPGSGSHYYCGDRAKTTVWNISREAQSDYVHPTQKPVALPEEAIRNSSKSGDIVVDLFGGSGSTLLACEMRGRICRTMELDPKYCDVIIKRWQAFTGKKAILERTGEEFDTLCASISEETVIK